MKEILDGIERDGWAVMPSFLEKRVALQLVEECQSAAENGDFRKAGVGRGKDLVIREDIRRDEVMWLRDESLTNGQKDYLERLEALRSEINQRFFLGLFGFEGHFAIYQEGAFYKAHLDRHAGTSDRIVTVILYLNPDWQPGDGGELKLWLTPGSNAGDYKLIEPRLGTLVCFMAGDHWHEVQAAKRPRMSITGWFRRRESE